MASSSQFISIHVVPFLTHSTSSQPTDPGVLLGLQSAKVKQTPYKIGESGPVAKENETATLGCELKLLCSFIPFTDLLH